VPDSPYGTFEAMYDAVVGRVEDQPSQQLLRGLYDSAKKLCDRNALKVSPAIAGKEAQQPEWLAAFPRAPGANIMVDENSKQMGQNSAALLDSVCAAIRRTAYLTLTVEWDLAPQLLSQIYESKGGFGRARAMIERGEGIGQIAVARYLDGRLPTGKIETALASYARQAPWWG
jgi:hypothetical protein